MNVFFVTRDVAVSTSSDAAAETRPPSTRCFTAPRGQQITDAELYFGTNKASFEQLFDAARSTGEHGVVRMLRRDSQTETLRRLRLPPRVRAVHDSDDDTTAIEDQLNVFVRRDHVRVAIINVHGAAFGDAIVSLTAFRELRRALSSRYSSVQLDVLQAPINPESERLYLESGVVDRIEWLPETLATLRRYDAYIDLAADPIVDNRPWVDGLLDALGVPSWRVPPSRKRNRLRRPGTTCITPGAARPSGRPVVLLHPRASTALRTMPDSLVASIVAAILRETDWTIWAAVPLPFRDDRVRDWSDWCRTFEHLTSLVATVDAVISTDTSVYHVADAFDVPSTVMFVAKPPGIWAAYYPRVAALDLTTDTSAIRQLDRSESFDHVREAQRLWSRVDASEVVALTQNLLASGIPS